GRRLAPASPPLPLHDALPILHAGSVGWSSPAEIDEIGIMPALTLAALRALEALGPDVVADAIVLDGDVDVLSPALAGADRPAPRSEEHTAELQSRFDLVCRLL